MTDPPSGGDGRSQEVVPVELLFDLVFVFAVSQLSHHLRSQITWRGDAQTAVLLCAVFGVWAYTSFQTTVLGPAHRHAQRALLMVIVVGLVMNAAIGQAFEDGPWAFVIPLLICQFGYAALTRPARPTRALPPSAGLVHRHRPPVGRRHHRRPPVAAGVVGSRCRRRSD